MDNVFKVRTMAIINALAGLWFFGSAWYFNVANLPNALNNWVVGLCVAVFAAVCIIDPLNSEPFSFLNCLLGAWMFGSPWIYNYTGSEPTRFGNSLIVGAVVFACSIIVFTW